MPCTAFGHVRSLFIYRINKQNGFSYVKIMLARTVRKWGIIKELMKTGFRYPFLIVLLN